MIKGALSALGSLASSAASTAAPYVVPMAGRLVANEAFRYMSPEAGKYAGDVVGNGLSNAFPVPEVKTPEPVGPQPFETGSMFSRGRK